MASQALSAPASAFPSRTEFFCFVFKCHCGKTLFSLHMEILCSNITINHSNVCTQRKFLPLNWRRHLPSVSATCCLAWSQPCFWRPARSPPFGGGSANLTCHCRYSRHIRHAKFKRQELFMIHVCLSARFWHFMHFVSFCCS